MPTGMTCSDELFNSSWISIDDERICSRANSIDGYDEWVNKLLRIIVCWWAWRYCLVLIKKKTNNWNDRVPIHFNSDQWSK